VKLYKVSWFIFVISLIFYLIARFDLIQLNSKAVQLIKSINASSKSISTSYIDFQINNQPVNCHTHWLTLIQIYQSENFDENGTLSRNTLSCSLLNARMLNILFPSSLNLAQLAIEVYPGQAFPLYWLYQSIEPKNSAASKQVLEEILLLNSADGLAWRYLAIILNKDGNIQSAIEANINSCLNGDPGSNGCYNAGLLLEQQGELEDAIYYYRLSRHEPYHVNADRLEAELLQQNP